MHRSRRSSFLAWFLSLATLLTTFPMFSSQAQAASPAIVISQVYAGGGNAGAPYQSDFIELFNRSAQPVSLSTWSVQYATAAGSSWTNLTTLSGTLEPGQYFLIREATGSGTGPYSPFPTPDATGNINLSATAGKVAVVNSATPLSGTCPAGDSIADLVGYGSGSNCSETRTAPGPGNASAIIRADACVDSDNNGADFTTANPPTPRNSVSPRRSCGTSPPSGTGQAAPAAVAPGAQSLLTVTVTAGGQPASTSIAVQADMSELSGPAAQTLYDDGTNGDVQANDLTFSYLVTVPATASMSVKQLPFTITDAEGRSGGGAIALRIQPPAIPSARLLIAELLIAPSTTGEPEEFIKIYNPTATPVDLSGWNVGTITGASSTASAAFPSGASIGAGAYAVATLNAAMYLRQVDPHATADQTFEYGTPYSGFGTPMIRNTQNSPALANTTAVVFLSDQNGVETDLVRYTSCANSGGVFNCNAPTPYFGDGWSGPAITIPQTQGFTAKNKILARAIDETTITATVAGNYQPDTNTAADWFNAAINSATGQNYWQGPGSQSATPLSNRDYIAGQMQSLPVPTWAFDGTVTGFMAPDNAFDTVAALFNDATTSIDLNMYEFELVDMAQVLASAARRGVTVRVLLEGQPCCNFYITDQTRYVAKLMHDAGAEVRYMASDSSDQRFRRYNNVNHAKYAIVDSAKTLVFSGNFKKTSTSRNPASGNRDWGVIIQNPEVAGYYKSIFAYDYDPLRTDSLPYGYTSAKLRLGGPAAAFVPDLSSDSDPGAYYPAPFSARTITGNFKVTPVMVPETDFLNSKGILGMVKGAQSEVLLEWATLNPYWGANIPNQSRANTPMPLVQELVNAARHGVKVRVLLDGKFDTSSDPEAKANSATVQYLNQVAQAEGLDMIARVMPFQVISGAVDEPGYQVREFPGFNEIHNKGIIVDGAQVLVSSINGTQSSWLRNREAAVIVENPTIGEYFGDAFWYDWYNGTPPQGPVISEVQYAPAGQDQERQWFELYNPTRAAIDLTGWSVANERSQWSVPAGTTLGAGATLTVARQADRFKSRFGFYPDLSGESLLLSETGGALTLLRADGSAADKVSWLDYAPDWQIETPVGQSLVRTNACKDTNSVRDWASADPQPGTATCDGVTPPPPARVANVLLSEVQYNPLSASAPVPGEFVELYNADSETAQLSGYKLVAGSGSFSLPVGTTLAPGAFLTVAHDGAAFQAHYGVAAAVTGMTIQLGNARGTVTIQNPAGHDLDSVSWGGAQGEWDLVAGPGWSLHRRDVTRENARTAADWVTGDPTPGTGLPADIAVPTLTLDPTAPDGLDGWYQSAVTSNGTATAWGAVTLELSQDGGHTWSPTVTRTTADALVPLPLSATVRQTDDTAGAAIVARVTDTLGRQALSPVLTVKKDSAAPTITWTGNAGTYTVDQMVNITCAASDALSGVAASTCQTITGPAYTFTLGGNTLNASASDVAGNEATGSVSFTVSVSYDSLSSVIMRLVTKEGIAGSLVKKLAAAKAAAGRGDVKVKQNILGAFAHEVDAQTGKAIAPADAALFKRLAETL